MRTPSEVPVRAQSLDRLAEVADRRTVAETARTLDALRRRLRGRTVWNVNSTARGGGVAELLQALLGYMRGAGIDARWVTIEGDAEFFRITKRLHHALHGASGDGSPLGEDEQRHYRMVLRQNAERLVGLARPGDFVILHDPQTAGLIEAFTQRGSVVTWRCHIGHDHVTPESRRGWSFLRPYLTGARSYVFSRSAYVPDFLPRERCVIIPPSVDPLSTKNQPLDAAFVHDVLVHAGILDGTAPDRPLTFRKPDSGSGSVERRVELIHDDGLPTADTPLIVQVSRWDDLKDPLGVMSGFARLASEDGCGSRLVLAGPDVRAVADDPEGAVVFDRVLRAWQELPRDIRRRVYLANLPMDDVDENATLVNALQRHASIVVQKSLQEGFGLTVTEAMAKGRPVVASGVGGIQDQIEDGESGLLIRDPRDLGAFSEALHRVLHDADLAARLGRNARDRIHARFLCNRHFRQYADLLRSIEGE